MSASFHLEYRETGSSYISSMKMPHEASICSVVDFMETLKNGLGCDFVVCYSVENGVKRKLASMGLTSK